jgi:hypothetical protein
MTVGVGTLGGAVDELRWLGIGRMGKTRKVLSVKCEVGEIGEIGGTRVRYCLETFRVDLLAGEVGGMGGIPVRYYSETFRVSYLGEAMPEE